MSSAMLGDATIPGARTERRPPVTDQRHLIGLLLGTEEDWPTAFEAIAGRLGEVRDGEGRSHSYDVERITIEPFNLRSAPRHELVIDRLAYWYYHPREWLKKIPVSHRTYPRNSPFFFPGMGKHPAYCALLRPRPKAPGRAGSPCRKRPD